MINLCTQKSEVIHLLTIPLCQPLLSLSLLPFLMRTLGDAGLALKISMVTVPKAGHKRILPNLANLFPFACLSLLLFLGERFHSESSKPGECGGA